MQRPNRQSICRFFITEVLVYTMVTCIVRDSGLTILAGTVNFSATVLLP